MNISSLRIMVGMIPPTEYLIQMIHVALFSLSLCICVLLLFTRAYFIFGL
jgi:hypothetical protein